MSNTPSANTEKKNIQRLLSSNPIIASACELDLLVFFCRHPRTLLTNEQLAAFVGYEMKRIAQSIDRFIDAGLLEKTQNPMHAARMYLLVLDTPEGEELKGLLELASTRQGRRDVLELLRRERPEAHSDHERPRGRLRVIA
jgi:DNA-binding MarR family transcriptional regulator